MIECDYRMGNCLPICPGRVHPQTRSSSQSVAESGRRPSRAWPEAAEDHDLAFRGQAGADGLGGRPAPAGREAALASGRAGERFARPWACGARARLTPPLGDAPRGSSGGAARACESGACLGGAGGRGTDLATARRRGRRRGRRVTGGAVTAGASGRGDGTGAPRGARCGGAVRARAGLFARRPGGAAAGKARGGAGWRGWRRDGCGADGAAVTGNGEQGRRRARAGPGTAGRMSISSSVQSAAAGLYAPRRSRARLDLRSRGVVAPSPYCARCLRAATRGCREERRKRRRSL